MRDTSLATTQDARSAYDALKPVHQRFLDAVMAGETPTAVVRQMRPHLKKPEVLASKWLARPDIRAARAELAEQALERVGITQAMILRELARIAFSDPRRLFDKDGNIKPPHELDDEAAAMVAGIEVIERELEAKDGKKTVKRKIKVRRWDKRQALRDLAEFAGMTKGEKGGGGTIFNVQINF